MDYRDFFGKVLESRRIPERNIKDEDKAEYLSLINGTVPTEWHDHPERVGFVDMILMRKHEDFFWNSKFFLYDRGMMEVFHKMYIVDPETYKPDVLYFSILSFLYDFFMQSSTSLHTGALDSINSIVDITQKPPDMIPIFDNDRWKEIIDKVRGNIISHILPDPYTSFNIVGFLAIHKELDDYIKQTYNLDPHKDFAQLSHIHFWITQFRTVYDFLAKYCDV